MSESRKGTTLIEQLPGDETDGPWKLRALPNGEVVATNPNHEPRFYHDQKLVGIGAHRNPTELEIYQKIHKCLNPEGEPIA